ncbi:MAG: LysM peptidoglycan-binding domain-containing protein [Verrucomicrobiota bacterium]
MASSQGSMAQSAPPENEVPASKHRLKATPTEILQHTIDEQGKKTEQLATQLSAQIEAQGKQLDDLAKRAELQTKQIETLNADLNRLTQVLLAHGNAEPSAAPASGHPAETPSPALPVKPAEPAAPAPETYTPDGTPTHLIKKGETLTAIARQHGTTVSELLRINKIEDERKLQIGQTLLLPKPAAPAPSPNPDTP